jgi:plasmid stability protein
LTSGSSNAILVPFWNHCNGSGLFCLEAPVTTITVKDIPDDLYAALKQSAAANHRSINREIIHCIEQAVRSRKMSVDEIVAEARRLQAEIGPLPINEEMLKEAKKMGRV